MFSYLKTSDIVNHNSKQSDWLISLTQVGTVSLEILEDSYIVFIFLFNSLNLLNEQCYSE